MGGITHRCRESDIEYFFRKYGKIRDISIKNKFAFVEFDDRRDADDACYDLHKKEFMGEIVTVEVARGTPHGRDKERWGHGGGRSRSRSRSRSNRRRSRSRSNRRSRSRSRGGRGGDRDRDSDKRRPVWLDKYGPPTRTEYRVNIENLSSRVSWQDLKDVMRSAGEVTYADAHRQERNVGVVEFASYSDVKNVIEKLDGKELNGRAIRIIDTSTSKGRKQSRSRSNSRSKSRSRSRSGRSRSRSKKSRSRSRGGRKSRSGSADKKSRSRSRSRSRRSRS